MKVDLKAARRYALALGEVARETGELETVVAQLNEVVGALDAAREFERALSNPSVPPATKRALLMELTGGMLPIVQRFAALLAEKRRSGELRAIVESLHRYADEVAGRERVKVVSAVPLDEAQRAGFRAALGKATGREVVVGFEVDAALMGGAIVQMGDVVYDGSVAGRLRRMAQTLRTAPVG
ncbi:MAG TPA: ATP synthase F1 subunit delta [Limnochordia bacterium]|nr:ATP synthase F1 subunit delta [Limnochordia bacterium]